MYYLLALLLKVYILRKFTGDKDSPPFHSLHTSHYVSKIVKLFYWFKIASVSKPHTEFNENQFFMIYFYYNILESIIAKEFHAILFFYPASVASNNAYEVSKHATHEGKIQHH